MHFSALARWRQIYIDIPVLRSRLTTLAIFRLSGGPRIAQPGFHPICNTEGTIKRVQAKT